MSSFGLNPSHSSFNLMMDNSMDSTNHVRRRCTWVEGHCMLEIFNHELVDYVGYRCICGKEINRDVQNDSNRSRESDPLSPRMMFMSCTGKSSKRFRMPPSIFPLIQPVFAECKLITHEACTNQILHPCVPTCFDEEQIICAFLRMYSSLLWNYRAGFAYSIEELDGNAPLAQADHTDLQTDPHHGEDPHKQPRFFSKERFLKGCDRDTRVLANTYMTYHNHSCSLLTYFLRTTFHNL